jgi:hypothetical protein
MIGEQVGGLVNQTLNELWARVVAFVPNLLAMILILTAGIIVAGGVRLGVGFLLAAAGGDELASRLGIRTVLQRAGVTRPPSTVAALVLAWTIFAVFVIAAIGALNLQIAADLLSRTLAYLPQILVALSLLVLGSLVGAFIHRSVLIAAVNAGVPSARFLAAAAHTAVMAVAVAMALEHLGVGRQIIVTAFTIVFGGVVFALALALGLGGHELARDALQRWTRRQPLDQEADDPRRHV